MFSIPQNLVQQTFDFDALNDLPAADAVFQINSVALLEQKRCCRCRYWFPATAEYWHHNKSGRDDLHWVCKSCMHEVYVTRYHHICSICGSSDSVSYSMCDGCRKRRQDNPHEKYCFGCKQWLSINQFDKHSTSKDGFRSQCKSCRHNDYLAHQEYHQESRQKRREALLAKSPEEQKEMRVRQNKQQRDRYAENKQAGICVKCFARPAEGSHTLCDHCLKKAKQSRDLRRDQVFAAYGSVCVVCGESHPAFLSVDHINNDGADHRRITGNGYRFYFWLRKHGFPKEGFQLLCANCNWLKYVSRQPEEKSSAQIWFANLRQKTLTAYGGKCVCCGDTRPEVLTVDHTNNDGAEHRKITGGGNRFYSWLRKNGFPQDGRFQLLCFNCNRASYYHDICPHQQ